MARSIIVNKVYLPVLHAMGRRWPCTSLSHSMAVNQIPVITVMLSTGDDVLHPSDSYDPIQIVRAMQDRSSMRSAGLMYCELWETSQSGNASQLKFKGFIAGAALVMQAGGANSTGKVMVQVNCMGLAMRLLDAPASQYIESTIESLKSAIMYQNVVRQLEEAVQVTGEMYTNEKVNLLATLKGHAMTAAGTPIARMLAYAVAMAKAASRSDKYREVDRLPPDPIVSSVIGGTLKLRNNDMIDDRAREAFAKQILESMLDGIRQMSIWDSLLRTIVSNDFLLQFVPRLHGDAQDDHKMVLSVVNTWADGRGLITLSNSNIISISTSPSTIEDINTPTVVFVNFADANQYMPVGNTVGIIGVAAVDPVLNRALQSYSKDYKLGYLMDSIRPDMHVSVRLVNSPSWLKGLLPSVRLSDASARETATVAATPQASTGDTVLAVTERQRVKRSVSVYTAEELANAYALARLVHDFKKGDTLNVNLDPGLRNGWSSRGLAMPLENCIGSTIELHPEIAGGRNVDTKLGIIRGVLQDLRYECNVGNSGSASYQIVLNRVRLVDGEDLYNGVSPLYTYV